MSFTCDRDKLAAIEQQLNSRFSLGNGLCDDSLVASDNESTDGNTARVLSISMYSAGNAANLSETSSIMSNDTNSNTPSISSSSKKLKNSFRFPFRADRSKTMADFTDNEENTLKSTPQSASKSNTNFKKTFSIKGVHKFLQNTKSNVKDWKRQKNSEYEFESPSGARRNRQDGRYKSADMLASDGGGDGEFSRAKSNSFGNILDTVSCYLTLRKPSKQVDVTDELVLKLMTEHQKTKEEAEELVRYQRLASMDVDKPVFNFPVYKLTSNGKRQGKKKYLQLDLEHESLLLMGSGCIEEDFWLSEIEMVEKTNGGGGGGGFSPPNEHCVTIETANCTLNLECENVESRQEIICRFKSFMNEKTGNLQSFSGILEKKSKSLSMWSKKEVRIEGSKLRYRSLVNQKPFEEKNSIDLIRGKAVVTPDFERCQFKITDGHRIITLREPNMNSVIYNDWIQKLSVAQNHPTGLTPVVPKEKEVAPEGLFEQIFEEIFAMKLKSNESSSYHLEKMENLLKQLQINMEERRLLSNASSKSGSVILLSNHIGGSCSYNSSLGRSSNKESSVENCAWVNSETASLNKSSVAASVISSSGNEKQDSTKSGGANRDSTVYLEAESITRFDTDDTIQHIVSAPPPPLSPRSPSKTASANIFNSTILKVPPMPFSMNDSSNIINSVSPNCNDLLEQEKQSNISEESHFVILEDTSYSNTDIVDSIGSLLADNHNEADIEFANSAEVVSPASQAPRPVLLTVDSRPTSFYDNCNSNNETEDELKSQPISDYDNFSGSDKDEKSESNLNKDNIIVSIVSPYAETNATNNVRPSHSGVAEEKETIPVSPNFTVNDCSNQANLTETIKDFNEVKEKPIEDFNDLPISTNSLSPLSIKTGSDQIMTRETFASAEDFKLSPSSPLPPPPPPLDSANIRLSTFYGANDDKTTTTPPPPPTNFICSPPPPPPPPPPAPCANFAPPPPPPPAPMPGMKMGRKHSKKGPSLKPVHWKAVSGTDRLDGSIWKTVPKIAPTSFDKDQFKKLETLFNVENSGKMKVPKFLGGGASSAADSYNLDQNRARNLELFIKRKEFDFDESLLNNYFSLNNIESQIHFLKQIKDFQPSDSDIKHFSNLSLDQLNSLSPVHRNMAVICKIPNFNLKLETLQSITDMKDESMEIERNIQSALEVCTCLRTNKNLHRLFYYCLVVGNQLNEGARKPKVEAFSIVDSLPRFNDVRSSTNPDYTLLNYIVELIHYQNPEILNVTEEIDMKKVDKFVLNGAEATSKSSNKGAAKRDGFYMLRTPVDVLTKSSAKAKENVDKIKEMQFAANGLEVLSEDSPEKYFIDQVEKMLDLEFVYQIIKCNDLLKSLDESYKDLLIHFAEDKSTDPAQLFSIVYTFLSNISQAKSQLDLDHKMNSPKPKLKFSSPHPQQRNAGLVDELTKATQKFR